MPAYYPGDFPKPKPKKPKPKPKKKQRGYGQASEGRTRKQAGGQTKFQQAYSKLTPAQKQSDTMKMYLSNRGGRKASGKPSLATNTGEPTNVRKTRPGGYATGGRVAKSSGGVMPVAKPN
jgi:hypothetical protein